MSKFFFGVFLSIFLVCQVNARVAHLAVQNMASKRCVAVNVNVPLSTTSLSAAVRYLPCQITGTINDPNQFWYFVKGQDNYVHFISSKRQQCLQGTSQGSLQLTDCRKNYFPQLFGFYPIENTSGSSINPQGYRIVGRGNGQCLTALANVNQGWKFQACGNNANQKFFILFNTVAAAPGSSSSGSSSSGSSSSGSSSSGSSSSGSSSSGSSSSGSSSSGSSSSGSSSSGSSSSGSTNNPEIPTLQLPIEVIGAGSPQNPTVSSAQLGIMANDVSKVSQLFVQCHRCGFYNAPEFEALSKPITKVAASLRLGEGKWINIADSSIKLSDVEKAHGGVNGGLLTIKFTVALDSAARAALVSLPATNRIEFRFNGTDGNSNGYRILDVQFQDTAGNNLTRVNKKWADIALEKNAGKEWSEQANQGKALWSAQNILMKSPIVYKKMRASCASCHAEDGRDVQYFNYSNNAIVQRSKFHGLSEQQGKQIAAYLRASLFSKVPHVSAATPWNPPYQPGPGLDSRPIHEWAAGAGLKAELADGRAFMKAFLGKAIDNNALQVSQKELDASMDINKMLNTREMPVPLQFPDWNAWLPTTHPLDIWTPDAGQNAGWFETSGNDATNPIKVYTQITTWLKTYKNPNGKYGDWSHLTPEQRERAQYWLNDLGKYTIEFAGGGRGDRVSRDPSRPYGAEIGGRKLQALFSSAAAASATPKDFTKEAFIERAMNGLFHWLGVKQWELAHTYGLEGDQRWFRGRRGSNGEWIGEGEKRGWPFAWPSVFYIAPHMLYVDEYTPSGKREFYFSWEPRLISYYRTNQWYQLQMTVNPGWPGASSGPMDWPYHMGFTTAVADDLITAKAPAHVTAAHLARYFQVRTKLAQLANTSIPFNQPDASDPNNLFKNSGLQSKAGLVIKLAPTEVLHRGAANHERSRYEVLNDIAPGLHLKFINSSISLYNAFFAKTSAGEWRRCDPNAILGSEPEIKSGFRFCLDTARKPLQLDGNGQPHLVGGWVDWTTEQYINWGIIAAGQAGAEPQRLKVWADWSRRMWPGG